MQLGQLEMHHFKRHAQRTLAFAPGLNILMGPNYSGKSSTLQAILFALYGANAVPGGLNVAVRDGAKKSQLEVNLNFHFNSQAYRVERTHKSATLLEGEKTIARGLTRVNRNLEELLGLDLRTFTQLRTLRQGEAHELLTLSNNELTALVEQRLGVDLIDRVLARGRDKIQFLQGQRAGCDPADSPERLKELKDACHETENQLQQMETELQTVQAQIDPLKIDYEKADARYQQARDQQHAYRNYLQAKNTLETAIQSAQKRQQAIEEELETYPNPNVDTLQTRLQQLQKQESENDALEWEHHRLRLEAAQLKRTGTELMQAIKAAEQPKPPSRQALEDAQKHLERAKQQHSVCEFQWKNAQTAYTQGICQACGRPFEGVDDKETLKKRWQQTEIAYQKATQDVESLQEKVRELERIQIHYENQQRTLVQQKQTLNHYTQQWKQLQARYQALKPPLQAEDKDAIAGEIQTLQVDLNRLRQLRAEQAATRSTLRELKQQLDQLTPVEPVEVEPFKEKAQALYQRLETQKEQANRLHLKIGGQQVHLNQLKEQSDRLQTAIERQQMIYHELDRCQRLLKLLRQHRESFLNEAWDQIYQLAGHFVQEVTDGDLHGLQNNGKGLMYMEKGRERPLMAASGAQRDLLGLALKLAIGRLSGQSQACLLLDEPTGALRDELAQALMMGLRAEGRQTLVVTHRFYDSSVAEAAFEFDRE